MKYIVVWDLDGTLVDGTQRLHAMPSAKEALTTRGWNKYNLLAGEDTPIQDNINMLSSLSNDFYTIILTGRCEIAKSLTIKHLKELGIHYDKLIMREEDNNLQDISYKEEKLREIGLEKILCCFDDLEHIVKHIRSLGVTCHQVTHYETKTVENQPREERELCQH